MSKVKKVRPKASVRNAKTRKTVKNADAVSCFEVRELDPFRKCGPATSVQWLYRVIERTALGATNHLVFYDRHGWYCEHGRACSAVAMARKHKRVR